MDTSRPLETADSPSSAKLNFNARAALLSEAARNAIDYLEEEDGRPVAPRPEAIEALNMLREPLPAGPTDAETVLRLLSEFGSQATVAKTGGRNFGFVNGGCLPAALAASWLVSAWDQNAAFFVQSPTAIVLEEIALEWTRELLGLPEGTGGAVVTGATMANLTALAAARHALLKRAGWDVEADGLQGAPRDNGCGWRRGSRFRSKGAGNSGAGTEAGGAGSGGWAGTDAGRRDAGFG